MTLMNLKITAEELNLLISLASDQLFRREFIDPKMPGYKGNPGEIKLGKALIERLKSMIGQESAKRTVCTGVTA